MKRTLLMIHSHRKARDQIWRHAPWYRKSCCEILGVNTIGGEHDWPGDFQTTSIGDENGYIPPEHGGSWDQESWVCIRFMDSLDFFLENYENRGVMITEPDSIFIKAVPPFDGDCFATPAGDCLPKWNTTAKRFYHPPWWLSRNFCYAFIKCAEKILFDEKQNSGGAMDCFFGSVVERLGVLPKHGGTWTCNGGDMKFLGVKARARNAILDGAWFIHGVDTPEELQYLVAGLKL